jgi:hypothetical protein
MQSNKKKEVDGSLKVDLNAAPEGEVVEKRSLLASIFVLLISIPALVGSWCWPVLVAGLLGMVVSDTAETFAHALR